MTDQPVTLVHPKLPGRSIQVASYEEVHRAAGWRRLEDAVERLVGVEDASDRLARVEDASAGLGENESTAGETPDNPPQASPRPARRSTTS